MAQDTGLAQGNLIWIDLEMTGLDTERDYIIEIATVVTDGHLNVIAEGPVLIVHQTAEILNGMDAWNKAQHSKTGLIDRVLSSRTNEADAERMTLDFLKKYVPPNKSPMCGNSICQDRRFLHRSMPELERYFHYRHIDVSTVKELAHRWVPNIATAYTKESSHRALDDIHESIRELRYYREHLFKMP